MEDNGIEIPRQSQTVDLAKYGGCLCILTYQKSLAGFQSMVVVTKDIFMIDIVLSYTVKAIKL